MDWLAQNWVLVFVAFIGMHMFGHGCHGGHGCRHERKINAQQLEKNLTKIGRKVINIK